MPALGERFRAAREARGLALSAVSEQIRIRSVYLAAIEDEHWATIGAPVYIRGFLRTYARFLGLDPEEVVATFNAQAQGTPLAPAPRDEPAPADVAVRGPERAPRTAAPLLWLAGLVAVALVAFVVYQEVTMSQASTAAVASPGPAASAPIAAAPGAVTSTLAATSAAASPGSSTSSASPGAQASGPSPSPLGSGATPGPLATGSASPVLSPGPNSLALVLSAPSWLRVTVDGDVKIMGTFPAGTTKLFHGKTALIRVGNAGGVQVIVDGKDLGKLGKSGDVVDRSFAL